jgi:hypothetical protein
MDFMPSEISLELTLEQQFQMRLMEEQVVSLSQQQIEDLLLQASRLLMLKDNVIRSLLKKAA